MNKNQNPVFFDEEMVDPYSTDKKDFLVKAEHLMRYWFAKEFFKKRVPEISVIYDIACGNGYGSKILSSVAGEVVGFDRNNQFLTEAAELNKLFNISYYQIDLEINSLIDFLTERKIKKPAAVVSFETIEHLEFPGKLLSALYTILPNGGYFIGSVPNSKYEPIIGGK